MYIQPFQEVIFTPPYRSNRRASQKCIPKTILRTDDVPWNYFAVIDPESKKLFIPLPDMLETRAMYRKGVPSLCKIFFAGRCRQGANCHQAHAKMDVVQHLRSLALAEPSCCHRHGACSNITGINTSIKFNICNSIGNILLHITLAEVFVTNGLRTLILSQENSVCNTLRQVDDRFQIYIPISSLCRQHANSKQGESCCRFGEECLFVHICRELHSFLNQPLKNTNHQISGVYLEENVAKNMEKDVETAFPSNITTDNLQTNTINSLMLNLSFSFRDDVWNDVVENSVGAEWNCAQSNSMLEADEVRQNIFFPISQAATQLSNSVDINKSPTQPTESLILAGTAPNGTQINNSFCSSSLFSKSLDSTPNGIVWRHNPYTSTISSNTVET